MTEHVNVQHAKTHLSSLLARVESGEEVIIARGGKPIARLSSLAPPTERELGFVAYELPASFFDDLPDDEIARWE